MTFSKGLNAGTSSAPTFRAFISNLWNNFVVSGFEVTDNGGLLISVASGYASIKDSDGTIYHVVSDSATPLRCTANITNYVYLHCDNGVSWVTKSSSATIPDDAIYLATVVTNADDITRVLDARPKLTYSDTHDIQHNKVYAIGPWAAETLTYYPCVSKPIYIVGIVWGKYYNGHTPTGSTTTTIVYNLGTGDDVTIESFVGDMGATPKFIPLSIRLDDASAYIKLTGFHTRLDIIYRYATD